MSRETRLTCPDCAGAGSVRGLAKYADGRPCAMETFRCFTCRGTGEISEEQARWRERGVVLRKRRVDGEPYRSIIGEAHAYGVTVGELADAEQGRTDPERFLSRPRPGTPGDAREEL